MKYVSYIYIYMERERERERESISTIIEEGTWNWSE